MMEIGVDNVKELGQSRNLETLVNVSEKASSWTILESVNIAQWPTALVALKEMKRSVKYAQKIFLLSTLKPENARALKESSTTT